MDELELLKKDWRNKGEQFPKLSYQELYNMLWKKSSSSVKWIFYISLIEFVFWSVLSFLLKDSKNMERLESYHADYVVIPLTVVGYLILGYFLYRFFMNYRKISATDTVSTLLENILRTRKTVKQYVWFNIGYFIVASFIIMGLQLFYDDKIAALIKEKTANGGLPYFYLLFVGSVLLVIGLVSGLIALFYRLVYGILLKRLKDNYNELKKIEA
jgi:hypothetical protein